MMDASRRLHSCYHLEAKAIGGHEIIVDNYGLSAQRYMMSQVQQRRELPSLTLTCMMHKPMDMG